MISPAQIRAGRHLASLSQADLAKATGLSLPTIKRAESERDVSFSEDAIAHIRAAIEDAGVEFTNGDHPGVRVRGDQAYGHLYDDEKIVGWIKNGELRSGRDNLLIALVNRGRLHDPETGEFICGLAQLGGRGHPLPARLKAKMK
jgi:transcriptional regulator with XRE-family HTH domain